MSILNRPVQSSITVYIIFIFLYILFFQKYFKEEIKTRKYVLPVIVITISVVIFYFFKLLQFHFT